MRRTRGTIARFSVAVQRPRILRTSTSGVMYCVVDESTLPARARVEMADPLARPPRSPPASSSAPGEAVDVVLGQPVEMVGDDPAGQLALVGSSMQSSCSCRHSETLRAPTPHGSSDCTRFSAICISAASTAGGMPLRAGELFERRAQVAVVVERLDDRAGERMVAPRQRQDVDLGVQVLAQADVGGDQVERAEVALRALGADARGRLLPAVALVRRVADRRERRRRRRSSGRRRRRRRRVAKGGVFMRAVLRPRGKGCGPSRRALPGRSRARTAAAGGRRAAGGGDGVLLFLGRAKGGKIHGRVSVRSRRCRRADCRRKGSRWHR